MPVAAAGQGVNTLAKITTLPESDEACERALAQRLLNRQDCPASQSQSGPPGIPQTQPNGLKGAVLCYVRERASSKCSLSPCGVMTDRLPFRSLLVTDQAAGPVSLPLACCGREHRRIPQPPKTTHPDPCSTVRYCTNPQGRGWRDERKHTWQAGLSRDVCFRPYPFIAVT